MLMELDYAATCIFSLVITTCAMIHCFHTRFFHESTVYSHSHIANSNSLFINCTSIARYKREGITFCVVVAPRLEHRRRLKDEILRSFESGLHSSFDPRVDGVYYLANPEIKAQ